MIDIKLIRENPKSVKENIKKKFQDNKLPLVDEAQKLDEKFRKIKSEEDELRSERNSISLEINQKVKDKKDVSSLKIKAKKIADQIETKEEQRKKLEKEIRDVLCKIPNIIHESVHVGKDASENVVREVIGEPKVPAYEIFNHGELAERLYGADFESARETSGKGFYYLLGDLAELNAALIQFGRSFMINQGFLYVEPPFMIRKRVVEGVMTFADMEDMMYKIEGEDLYLIGTSEHVIMGMFMDKSLKAKDLPIKITSFSPCFRKEIGSHGVDEKGFYRLHQFQKQEMVVICDPKESYEWYNRMLHFTIDVFRALNIPVRVFECCSGDLGDLKTKSCDVEAWSPKQKQYFEVGSLSNIGEAQARRLNIKVESGPTRYYPHSLNNTVIAVPRALRFLMENNQEKDGSINIPKVLQPYIAGKKKIGLKN